MDVNHMRTITARAIALLGADHGRLWGPVEARWMFCDEQDWIFTEPVPGATELGGLWRIPAPGNATANTAVEWDGRWWAQISDPDRDGVAMDVLLLHELWHATVQRRLLEAQQSPAPEDTLDTIEGRALFFAEVWAWMAVLDNPHRVEDAVAIRQHRCALTPANEWERQRQLELTEGLAEYSGIVWACAGRSFLEDTISKAAEFSLVRSGCYRIGPAIGLALDALGVAWRNRVTSDTDLGGLTGAHPGDLDGALKRVDYPSLVASAQRREDALAAERARRAAAFAGPLLELPIDGLTFDPRFVEASPLGALYRVAWIQADGVEVEAADGLVVSSDWKRAYLPCPQRPRDGESHIAGPGWTATLANGWESHATWTDGRPAPPRNPALDLTASPPTALRLRGQK